MPYVEANGNFIFKSTLISQLNGNPTLSNNRFIPKESGMFTQDKKPIEKKMTCSILLIENIFFVIG